MITPQQQMVVKEERKELQRRERILLLRRFNDNSSRVDGYKVVLYCSLLLYVSSRLYVDGLKREPFFGCRTEESLHQQVATLARGISQNSTIGYIKFKNMFLRKTCSTCKIANFCIVNEKNKIGHFGLGQMRGGGGTKAE